MKAQHRRSALCAPKPAAAHPSSAIRTPLRRGFLPS
jgi:hypothetical protein